MPDTVSRERLLFSHLFVPCGIFFVVAVALEWSSFDLWLADVIYHWCGDAWSLRDAWFTSVVIHEGGRKLVAAMTFIVVALNLVALVDGRLRWYRRGFAYLLASALLSALAINVLKETTHIDCPWDLLRYGGAVDYARNFSAHDDVAHAGACFPAGHASAGYAWFGLYYFAREYRSPWRLRVLIFVLTMGLTFGAGQQMRGAHFVSHDVWSLGLCWLLSTALYFCFYPPGILGNAGAFAKAAQLPGCLKDSDLSVP